MDEHHYRWDEPKHETYNIRYVQAQEELEMGTMSTPQKFTNVEAVLPLFDLKEQE
jgi:hypothetical protein